MTKLTRADGLVYTVEEERKNLESAKKLFQYTAFCYTWVTVESLLDKIDELQKQIDSFTPPPRWEECKPLPGWKDSDAA